MKRIFTLYLFILFCLILQAQEELYERVYVHTDKTCYLAGEEVWLKFYTIDTHFRPSSFSKVGYLNWHLTMGAVRAKSRFLQTLLREFMN